MRDAAHPPSHATGLQQQAGPADTLAVFASVNGHAQAIVRTAVPKPVVAAMRPAA